MKIATNGHPLAISEYPFVARGYSFVTKGYSDEAKEYSFIVKEYSLNAKEYSVITKEYSINAKGYSFVIKECSIIIKGYKIGLDFCNLVVMKNLLPFLSLLFISPFSKAQMAVFSADTVLLHEYIGNNTHLNKIYEMKWRINGKPLTWGSAPVKIKPDANKLDTILFKKNEKTYWDTIICNITQPNEYTFVYNPCCGAFNIFNSKAKGFESAKVVFKLNSTTKNIYLGLMEQGGVLLKQNLPDTLKFTCASAMNPNIYRLQLLHIDTCTIDTGACVSDICFINSKGEVDYEYNFGYTIKSILHSFLYAPLDNKPFVVIYDPKTKKIQMK